MKCDRCGTDHEPNEVICRECLEAIIQSKHYDLCDAVRAKTKRTNELLRALRERNERDASIRSTVERWRDEQDKMLENAEGEHLINFRNTCRSKIEAYNRILDLLDEKEA